MIFYSVWRSTATNHGTGYFSYVLPEQYGRERYFADDVSWWIVPGTLDCTH